MSGECSSSLNSLPPDGILDDSFAARPSFSSGGELELFDEETHLDMLSEMEDFLSEKNTKVSLHVQSLFGHL